MIPKEVARLRAAEELWLSEEASWSIIWKRARALGEHTYERIRALVAEMLDGMIPAY